MKEPLGRILFETFGMQTYEGVAAHVVADPWVLILRVMAVVSRQRILVVLHTACCICLLTKISSVCFTEYTSIDLWNCLLGYGGCKSLLVTAWFFGNSGVQSAMHKVVILHDGQWFGTFVCMCY